MDPAFVVRQSGCDKGTIVQQRTKPNGAVQRNSNTLFDNILS